MIGLRSGRASGAALDARVWCYWPLLLGLGLYWCSPLSRSGRPKPDLGERLRRMDVDERIRVAELKRVTRGRCLPRGYSKTCCGRSSRTPAACCGPLACAWAWRRPRAGASACASSGRASGGPVPGRKGCLRTDRRGDVSADEPAALQSVRAVARVALAGRLRVRLRAARTGTWSGARPAARAGADGAAHDPGHADAGDVGRDGPRAGARGGGPPQRGRGRP